MEEVRIKIYGDVQGVGFRWKAREVAKSMNINGYTRNLEDGTLEIVAQGPKAVLEKYVAWVKIGPSLSRVDKIETAFRESKDIYSDFQITH